MTTYHHSRRHVVTRSTVPCETCSVEFVAGTARVDFCPMHQAAPLMLAALRRAERSLAALASGKPWTAVETRAAAAEAGAAIRAATEGPHA